MVNALNSYDVPLVLGSVITISIVFIVSIFVDIVYSLLDQEFGFRSVINIFTTFGVVQE